MVDDGPDQAVKAYAVRDLAMVVGDKDTVGYDLDGVCTCDSRPGSARAGASPCAPRRAGDRLCDAVGGRDNAGAAILQNRLPQRPGASFDVGYQRAAEDGLSGFLLSLSEYDGRADDPQVRVEAFDSPGLDPPLPCEGTAPDAGQNAFGAPRPSWNGCDAWRVGESFKQGGVGRAGTREAWVSGGKLYARFPTLRLRVASAYVTFFDVRVEARIVPGSPGNPERLTNGVFAGATRANDLLVAFGELRTGVDGGPLCLTPAFASLVEDTCTNLDLTLRTVDERSAVTACDAASIVLSFGATIARQGSVAADSTVATACAKAGIVPSCR